MKDFFEAHCWAEVDLDALKNNYRLIQELAGDAAVCAIVKADAYGHGDVVIAQTLAKTGVKWFGVSCFAEAMRLRTAGIEQPILILGMTQPDFAAALAENRITQSLFNLDYAKALAAAAQEAGVTVECHLKVDTGMARIGFDARADFDEAVQSLIACSGLDSLKVTGIFTHFAVADSHRPEHEAYTDMQHALFCKAVDCVSGVHPLYVVHCCNSAALVTHPEWSEDMVRAGIILYGHDPSADVHLEGLKPVMSLKSVVSNVKMLQPGESVSYGCEFTADREMRVATLCCGYADGYSLRFTNQGVVSIHGKPAPVIGRVCMDQMMVDASAIPEVTVGDEAVVLGDPPADSFLTGSAKIGTIPYDILCVINRRVPRVYKENGEVVRFLNYLTET